MKYIFIINPTSGKGKALKVSENIKRICEEENLEYEMYFTKEKDDATKIAKKFKHKSYIIFSVGGDGTLNEVLNGIVGSKNMLGIIPCGSGNDFYKTIKKIEDPLPQIDIGKINDKYFINIISIGIDAEVASNAELMKKRKISPNNIYNASIVYTFFKFKFKDIEFEIDGESNKGKCTILTVCNGEIYGGGYKIAPEAKLQDGYFDIYYVDKMQKLSLPMLINKLKKGTHTTHKKVHRSKATSIKFKSDYDLICNIDGEIEINKKFDIKLLPKEITIYNNQDLVKRFLK